MNWQQQWQELRRQVQANMRLRVGLVLVGALPLLYLVLVLKDEAEGAAQQYRIAANRLAVLKAQVGQNEWAERQQAASILKAELEGRLWQSSTPALARAALQDWLNEQTTQTGIANVVLAMEDSAPGSDATEASSAGLTRIAAKLSFPLNQANLNAFLQRLIDAPKHVVIEQLNITNVPAPRAEMIVAIFVAREAAP